MPALHTDQLLCPGGLEGRSVSMQENLRKPQLPVIFSFKKPETKNHPKQFQPLHLYKRPDKHLREEKN